MTPAARISAAIEILDAILEGAASEKVLTTWARQNRYAGSGDRAAIRDLVFDAVRRKRSYGWLGGTISGRGLMIGACRADGRDPDEVFTGEGYAPPVLSSEEREFSASLETAPLPVQFDCPDWLWPAIEQSLAQQTQEVLTVLQSRASVFLRINAKRTTRTEATRALADDGIAVETHPLSPNALMVTQNPRRVHQSAAYRDGLVELQDVASQALVDQLLPYAAGKPVLDFCAGGGGKALALAAGGAGQVTAHDIQINRMNDIPVRAKRAGVHIATTDAPQGEYSLVLCDAPCSGTGAWARQPDARWTLTEQRLSELHRIQLDILKTAQAYVAADGVLAYATCSLLASENEAQIDRFLQTAPDWSVAATHRFLPTDGGDGFFLAILERINGG